MANKHRWFVRILCIIYCVAIVGLFLYSYTQVDLNLTLSRITFWFAVQDFFQHIGYFDRPFSTYSYIGILTALFVSYGGFLLAAQKKWLDEQTMWKLLIGSTVLLVFSYPAFSYDLFNYMFDARIITQYGQNPYIHKALDYPTDPWIQFMRWTHRTYPYGPVWLGLTVPLSWVGQQYFLPTLYLFKALMATCFLGLVWSIKKILAAFYKKEEVLYGLVFFAFNPLVIIESLVSAHNDIVMLFFAVVSLYFLLRKRYVGAYVLLALSIGIKFATVFLLPVYIAHMLFQWRKRPFSSCKITYGVLAVMSVALVAVTKRSEFQPWYLLYVLRFMAFIAHKRFITLLVMIISLLALLMYVSYVYMGNWNGWVLVVKLRLLVAIGISSLFLLPLSLREKATR